MQPCVSVSAGWPSSWARCMRSWLLEKPAGNRSNISTAFQSACTVGSAKRSADTRWPSTGPRPLELLQGLFGQNRIVRDGLDFEHTPVGLKSDVAKRRQVVETLSDVEVAGVVDGGLGAERLAFFVILLNARAFVVNVQRRDHAVGDD